MMLAVRALAREILPICLGVGVLLGYVAGQVKMPTQAMAEVSPVSQPRTPLDIPPVPNPPLYPDPAQAATHWRWSDIQKSYELRAAAAKAHPDRARQAGQEAAEPVGMSFRTHSLMEQFRVKWLTPRPSNRAGVMSQVDDADQHEGISHVVIFVGGHGQWMTDGEIENRQYQRSPSTFEGPTVSINTSEFQGQPIKNGKTYDVKPGDWLAVPANVPHWPGYNPIEPLDYVALNIRSGGL